MRQIPLSHQVLACIPCTKQAGIALVSVLFLIGLLQLLATATVGRLVLDLRALENMRNRVQAVHAADAGWILCTRLLEQGKVRTHVWVDQGEPAYWRNADAFEGNRPTAFDLAVTWPYTIRAPQCLVEQWASLAQPDTSAYLLTVRGFGATLNAQAWVQSITLLEHANWRHTWRLVVGRP